MLDHVNSAGRRLFDVLLWPFQDSRWTALAVVSLATAVMMLLIYKRTSNQEGIRSMKSRMMAHLLESRLYRHSLRESFKAQGAVLGCNLKYLGYSLVPLLVMIVPMVLLMAQLDVWFGRVPIQPGQTAMLKVRLDDGTQASAVSAAIESGRGFLVETPPVRIDAERELVWRLRATEAGARTVNILIDGETVTKEFVVGGKAVQRVSEMRVAPGWFDQLVNPGEPAIRRSPVRAVAVSYPALRINAFGWRLHWLVPYFVLCVIFALALKSVFKVDF